MRQRHVLLYVQEFIATMGYSPTMREIGRGMSMTSVSTVFSHLEALEKKGYIRRQSDTPRTLVVLKAITNGERETEWMVCPRCHGRGRVVSSTVVEASHAG